MTVESELGTVEECISRLVNIAERHDEDITCIKQELENGLEILAARTVTLKKTVDDLKQRLTALEERTSHVR